MPAADAAVEAAAVVVWMPCSVDAQSAASVGHDKSLPAVLCCCCCCGVLTTKPTGSRVPLGAAASLLLPLPGCCRAPPPVLAPGESFSSQAECCECGEGPPAVPGTGLLPLGWSGDGPVARWSAAWLARCSVALHPIVSLTLPSTAPALQGPSSSPTVCRRIMPPAASLTLLLLPTPLHLLSLPAPRLPATACVMRSSSAPPSPCCCAM